MSTHTNRELALLVLQFLNEEKFSKTARMLEQESGWYFNMKYFEDQVLAGKLDDAESYLLRFTSIDENAFSTKIFYLIRKQKYIEALDRKDCSKAVEILLKDLKVFETFKKGIYNELTELIALENIREHERLSIYVDATSARKSMLQEIGKLIVNNPQLNKKLEFPNVQPFELRNLINQSINWQNQHYENQRSNLVDQALFVDRECQSLTGTQIPPNISVTGVTPEGAFYNTATPAPLQHEVPPSMRNSLSPTGQLVASGAIIPCSPQNAGFLIWPRRPPASNTRNNSQCVRCSRTIPSDQGN